MNIYTSPLLIAGEADPDTEGGLTGMSSDAETKDADDAVHGLILPSDCTASITHVIPVAGACCV